MVERYDRNRHGKPVFNKLPLIDDAYTIGSAGFAYPYGCVIPYPPLSKKIPINDAFITTHRKEEISKLATTKRQGIKRFGIYSV